MKLIISRGVKLCLILFSTIFIDFVAVNNGFTAIDTAVDFVKNAIAHVQVKLL